MRGHHFVVEHHPDRPGEFLRRVVCLDPEQCGGWFECPEDHIHNGHLAGLWECLCDPGTCACDASPTGCVCPFAGEDEFTFHRQRHVHGSGSDWALPYRGCVVAGEFLEAPDDLPEDTPGTWVITDDWDAYDMLTLILGERLDSPADPVTTQG